MKQDHFLFLIAVVLFGLCMGGCNRPLPAEKVEFTIPTIPGEEALVLTRTAISKQIEGTLTAIVSTADYTLEQTAAPTLTKPAAAGQATPEAANITPPATLVFSIEGTKVNVPIVIAGGITVEAPGALVNATPTPTEVKASETPAVPMTPAEVTPPQITPLTPPEILSPTPTLTSTAIIPAVETARAESRPAVAVSEIPVIYYLHSGEFPWCLARRFNIDPQQILWLNGFTPGQLFRVGQPVYLPQNPYPFPGQRALHAHPAMYQVGYGETIFSIACFFGDVDPLQIAAVNNLQPPFQLCPGQVLTIP